MDGRMERVGRRLVGERIMMRNMKKSWTRTEERKEVREMEGGNGVSKVYDD